MQFDPTQRLSKYHLVSQQLKHRGHSVTVHTRSDLLDAMTVRDNHDESHWVLVFRRKRGWFLSNEPGPAGRIYQVTNADNVVKPIERCLKSFPVTAEIADAYGLKEILRSIWAKDEWQEDLDRWEKYGWRLLLEDEINVLSRRYEEVFWQDEELVLPEPSVMWTLKDLSGVSREQFEVLETELTARTLRAFQETLEPATQMFSLDWQHPCFAWNPHKMVDKPFPDYWANPILSQGEDYIYLSEAFDLGIFSLSDRTFHVFGEQLVPHFVKDLPGILQSSPQEPQAGPESAKPGNFT